MHLTGRSSDGELFYPVFEVSLASRSQYYGYGGAGDGGGD